MMDIGQYTVLSALNIILINKQAVSKSWVWKSSIKGQNRTRYGHSNEHLYRKPERLYHIDLVYY